MQVAFAEGVRKYFLSSICAVSSPWVGVWAFRGYWQELGLFSVPQAGKETSPASRGTQLSPGYLGWENNPCGRPVAPGCAEGEAGFSDVVLLKTEGIRAWGTTSDKTTGPGAALKEPEGLNKPHG